MSKDINDFCMYCTGNNKSDIHSCEDKYCPFYAFRFGGLTEDKESEVCKQIMKDTGMIK